MTTRRALCSVGALLWAGAAASKAFAPCATLHVLSELLKSEQLGASMLAVLLLAEALTALLLAIRGHQPMPHAVGALMATGLLVGRSALQQSMVVQGCGCLPFIPEGRSAAGWILLAALIYHGACLYSNASHVHWRASQGDAA